MAVVHGYTTTKKGGRCQIRLSLTEPNKEDDSWSLTATATVTDVDGPVGNIPVQFYHNGYADGSPVETDDEGEARMDFAELKKGNHTFKAKVVGLPFQSERKVSLKEEKRQPAKLIVSVTRRDEGKNLVMFQVLTDDKRPVSGSTIRVIDRDHPQGYYDLPQKTNETGTVVHEITVPSGRKIVTAHVLGSDLQRVINLYR